MSCEDRVVPGVRRLSPYLPGKPIAELARELGCSPEGIIKLASNENPLGCSERIHDVILQGMRDIARYPDGSGFDLRHALAKFYQLSPEQITLGNGSNDVLEMLVRTFVAPGQSVIVSEYAFAIYALVAQAVGAEVTEVPALDYGHDLEAMIQAVDHRTRMFFIANPNNPTGTSVSHAAIKAVLERIPNHVMVVLDEAYFEYADQGGINASSWLQQFSNLVICRTFSKAYGLAAMRVGYALSGQDVAGYLNRVRQPFNVGSFSLLAAQAALSDQDFVQQSRNVNRKGRLVLAKQLESLGVSVLPSEGNFLCLGLGRPAVTVYQQLLQQGVIVRPLMGYRMPEHIRVTVGTDTENARFLEAFQKIWDTP